MLLLGSRRSPRVAIYRFAQAKIVSRLFVSMLMDSHDRRYGGDFRASGRGSPWTGSRNAGDAGSVTVLLVITDSDEPWESTGHSGVQVAETLPGQSYRPPIVTIL